MNTSDAESATDVCYRCGYDLRATPDDRPCPECGLLAARSRRSSDELRHTRPKWLWSLAWGAILILFSIFGSWVWLIASTGFIKFASGTRGILRFIRIEMSGLAVISVMLLVGVILLTLREGYPPADAADRILRRWLRIAATAPLLAVGLMVTYTLVTSTQTFQYPTPVISNPLATMGTYPPRYAGVRTVISHIPIPAFAYAAIYVATFGSAPLPLLLFLRLHGLSKRARSAHLAEHCLIVGVGAAASVIYGGVMADLFENPQRYGLRADWSSRGSVSLGLILGVQIAAIMMILWSVYLLIRFTISFIWAARAIHRA